MKSGSFFSKMHTSGLIVEHRHSEVALSVDLAFHMSHRQPKGTIAVATSHPQALISSVRKQWLRLIRLVERERASTLNRQRIDDLSEAIRFMQTTSFTAKDPVSDPCSYVSFATVEQFTAVPPICNTLYIVKPITKAEQYMLASWMRPGGLVVIYDK